ncbi:CHAT domain-containing protein [Actinophytocola oryzae]|uniref:CHAT domain-containing protein n=1 Tax=Actinophytocola oryzae TaxID=502181 RepID=UPI001062AF1A|nr:CHAT domain-containing protein [Actinophytocola oryzae]
MLSIIRTTRDLLRVARSGDPHALDRAVRANPDLVARGFRTPKERLYLGLAWRDRARLITDDVADLDRAVETLELVATGWPLAQAELALALWLRYAFTGLRADADRAVRQARAAEAASDLDRPREVLAHIVAQLPAPADPVARGERVTGADGRVAVVWAGRHGGAERRVVTIGDEPADLDANAFAELWDRCPWDVEVLLRVGTDLLPYRATPDLAADALVSVATPVTVRGPYRVAGTVACSFVLSGHFAGQTRRVAHVTVDQEPIDDELARRLLYVELCTTELTDFHWIASSPVPVGDRRSAPELVRCGASALTTAEFGEAVLRFATHYEHAGLTCVWLRPTQGGYAYGVRRDEDEPVTVMQAVTEDWPPPDERIEAEAATWDQLRAFHAETYRRDLHNILSGEHTDEALLTAFEKFTFHFRFTDPESDAADDTVRDGLALTETLADGHFTYAAEWVATSCARLAGRRGQADARRALLRHAAMACESAGLFETALAHYEDALDVDGPCEDAWLERNLHISYATTCVSLFTTHELEDDPLDEDLARKALAHLDVGERLTMAAPEEETGWARLAIPAHRWRLRALLGEHERAEAELARLVDDPAMAGYRPLRASTVLFRLAALRTLDDPRFEEVLLAAAQDPGMRFVDRRIVLDTFLADRLIATGELTEAFMAAEEAYELQVWQDVRTARTPLPAEAHGGDRSVDTLARMCRAWWSLERSGELPEQELLTWFRVLRWRVETAKSRWLNRDLDREVSTPAGLDERLSTWANRVRAELVSGQASVDREVYRDQPARLTALSRDERVTALRARLPEGAALVTFYEARDFTLVSCATPERSVHVSVPVSRRDLAVAVRYLQAGFSGAGIYAPIDPERPFDLPDHFLTRLRALGASFTPMIPVLRDSPFVLVAPHGAWHNLPVHALLLPQLWDSGRNPALSYVPSLATASVLFERAGGMPSRASVAAYPLADPERDLFQDSHSRVVSALRPRLSTVDSLFGRDVTPAEVMSMADRSDLLHVLAHGTTPADPRAIMDAGLALSPGTGTAGLLTASGLSRARLAGTHLTLQACSVGRVVTSASDELWGPARSALLAGASSVLAPMWNADLHSSTRLLGGFYDSWLGAGKSKAQAFTEAQRDMYRASEADAWRHLYHWAAFKLMGA